MMGTKKLKGFLFFLFVFVVFPNLYAKESIFCENAFEKICGETQLTSEKLIAPIHQVIESSQLEVLKQLGYGSWRDFYESQFTEIQMEAPKFTVGNLKKFLTKSSSRELDSGDWEFMASEKKLCKEQIQSFFSERDKLNLEQKINNFSRLFDQLRDYKTQWIQKALSHIDLKRLYENMDNALCNFDDYEIIDANGLEVKRYQREKCLKLKSLRESFTLVSEKKYNQSQKTTFFKQVEEFILGTDFSSYTKEASFSYLYLDFRKSISNIQRLITKNSQIVKKTLKQDLSRKIDEQQGSLSELCDNSFMNRVLYNSIVSKGYKKRLSISRSQGVVSSVLKKVYPKEVMDQLEKELEILKQALFQVLEELNLDIKTLDQIKGSLSKIHIWRPSLSRDFFFKRDPLTGLKVLDSLKQSYFSNFLNLFSNPNLLQLKAINAFYLPNIGEGKERLKKTIFLYPPLISIYKQAPWSVRYILAHELAHHIDFFVSPINSFNGLSKVEESLLSCYSQESSFKMLASMAGESVSDYFASEVLNKFLVGFSFLEEKEKIIKESLSLFCLIKESTGEGDPHPSPYHRISAIFMSNPHIRDQLFCKKPQKYYRNCALKPQPSQ